MCKSFLGDYNENPKPLQIHTDYPLWIKSFSLLVARFLIGFPPKREQFPPFFAFFCPILKDEKPHFLPAKFATKYLGIFFMSYPVIWQVLMNLSYARALRVHSHKYILLGNHNLHYFLLLNSMKIGWVQPRLEYQKKWFLVWHSDQRR